MANAVCRVIRNVYADHLARVAKEAPVNLARAVAKPLQAFARTPKQRRVISTVQRVIARYEHEANLARQLFSKAKLVGLAGVTRNQDAVNSMFILRDTISSRVLADWGREGRASLRKVAKGGKGELFAPRGKVTRSAATLVKRTLEEFERISDSPLARSYDRRYLNPERLDVGALQKAIDSLTDQQIKLIADLAEFDRYMRANNLRAKRLALRFGDELVTEGAALHGKRAVQTVEELTKVAPRVGAAAARKAKELAELGVDARRAEGMAIRAKAYEKRNSRVFSETGLTVTSYEAHMTYDVLVDGDPWSRLNYLKHLGDASEISAELKRIMSRIGDEAPAKVREDLLGTTDRVVWVRRKLAEYLAENPEDVAEVEKSLTRESVLQMMMAVDRSHPERYVASFVKMIPRKVFVPWFRKRMRREISRVPVSPLDSFPYRASRLLRQAYVEPLAAWARTQSADVFGAGTPAEDGFRNYMNALLGVTEASPIDPFKASAPGGRSVLDDLQNPLVRLAYFKMLWANPRSAFTALLQLPQVGLGRMGAWHGANAARMLASQDGWFVSRLLELNVADTSFTAMGGIAASSPAVPTDAIRRRVLETVDALRGARSREDALGIFNAGVRGFTSAMLVAGDFIGHVERSLRFYVGAAQMSRAATRQLLENIPGAKVVRSGGGMYVRTGTGELLDPVVELKKAYNAYRPGTAALPSRLVVGDESGALRRKLGVHIDWDRVVEDTTYDTLDSLGVFSAANYSPLERFIRAVPVVGPAAGMFMNFPLHYMSRLAYQARDVLRFLSNGIRGKMGLASHPKGTDAYNLLKTNASDSFYGLVRFAVGTQLVAGPYAFTPVYDLILRAGHAVDPDIPNGLDDPEGRALLDTLEKVSLPGILGIDLSRRLGLGLTDTLGFFTGGRFADNPISDMVGDAMLSVGLSTPFRRATPRNVAKARYRTLGSKIASVIDPDTEFGRNPVGRSVPFLPLMLTNLMQLGVDYYDSSHPERYLVNELGEKVEDAVPTHMLVKRFALGRSIYDREKMRAVAERRPTLHAELTWVRQRFVDAYHRRDVESMKRLNTRYQESLGVKLEEGVIHPDLRLETQDTVRWMLRHATDVEYRQLRAMPRGVLRTELNAAISILTRYGYARDGRPDDEAITQDIFRREPTAWSQRDMMVARAYRIILGILSRPAGQAAALGSDVAP